MKQRVFFFTPWSLIKGRHNKWLRVATFLILLLILIYFIINYSLHGKSCSCPSILLGIREWKSMDHRTFAIQTTWDGQCFCHDPITVSLGEAPDGDIVMKVEAPFFNSPAKPDGPAGQPFPKLWDYEVVEAFFLNDNDHYLEVELSPHGQHLLLLLNGRRKMVKDQLQLNFVATITGNQWTGEAKIPRGYLPPGVTKFNAYAIHGEGETRQYESLYPVTEKTDGMQPDFHRLELFQPLDMNSVLKNYNSSLISDLWAPFIRA